MSSKIILVVDINDVAMRLDAWLAGNDRTISRTHYKSLIKSGQVMINGLKVCDPNYRVMSGEQIIVHLPEPKPAVPKGEKIPLTVIYEDSSLIVIDKPAGMVVHPGVGNWDGTLVNALLNHCQGELSGIGGVMRPGIVHRLDKLTSGLMVVAKSDIAHRKLSKQFAAKGKLAKREYYALVWGIPAPLVGRIELAIGRDKSNRKKMASRNDGKPAMTNYRTIERLSYQSGTRAIGLLHCRLASGRTHQIRVHLAAIGHPVVADPDYASHFSTMANTLPHEAKAAIAKFNRQALHAFRLSFIHPVTDERLTFTGELPDDLKNLIALLRASATQSSQTVNTMSAI